MVEKLTSLLMEGARRSYGRVQADEVGETLRPFYNVPPRAAGAEFSCLDIGPLVKRRFTVGMCSSETLKRTAPLHTLSHDTHHPDCTVCLPSFTTNK